MASIENRIVQMQFDNSSFERKLSDTLRSLDKLNTTLANAGSKNGLTQLNDSVKGFNLNGISASIEGVSAKFLAMSTIAITALSAIVNRAVDAGIRIVSALSLDPVMGGFQEYQTQIGAIQTILSNTDSKGTTLDQVNAALDQLNEYSDKTIYNFTQMARNIGTFTAAGVDLDTSVQSIKGIANLAALSGSSSEQASTAMYQLSQAMASGTVKLMDWNSVVNAGMGGEIFQKALFDAGQLTGAFEGAAVGQTFQEWTDAGNSFRGSLETGWLTAEVLTTTLAGFTGELDKSQLMAMGYTEQQATEIARIGQLGVEAATKVRTLKALLETTKEALGSGWAQSFRIIFGDFEEATELFSGLSNIIGGMIGKGAADRNALLQGWSDLGGRAVLIESLYKAFEVLSTILRPIKEAFQEIFPPMTAQRLYDITVSVRDLLQALVPGEATINNIKRIFTGFFGALEIGWTVIKETIKFISNLFTSVSGAGQGKFLAFIANIGDFFTDLNKKLVEGGGIKDFFAELVPRVTEVVEKLKELAQPVTDFISKFDFGAGGIIGFFTDIKDAAIDFFKSFGDGAEEITSGALERIKSRFSGIGDVFGDLWEPLGDAMGKVTEVLGKTWDILRDWFSNLGDKLVEILGPGEFDAVLDALNVSLFAGIALALKKFLSGSGFNIGSGLFSNITEAFGELTGVLEGMQANLKATALLKIAGAVAILVAALLVLSLMDSEALTRALTAMGVGFGQLITAFALMNSIGITPAGAAKLALMSGAMILMASAMLILAAAVKILGSMDLDELMKGLASITVLLGVLVGASLLLSTASGPMLRGSIGMIAMGIALNILALAVKQFANMNWTELSKGLAGVAGGLLILAGALNLMPANSVLSGVGLILTAIALTILAKAVKEFAEMSWTEMSKGMAGIAGGLLIIAAAVNLMPPTMPLIGLGLILVAVALKNIATAMEQLSGMTWGEMARGLAGMAGALLILAVAMHAMSGSIGGAIALGIVAVGLGLLVKVIKEFGKINTGVLVKGLLGIAGVFLVLGVAAGLMTPVIPSLFLLGAALLLLGAGFALFGVGAQGVAKAFEILAKAGGAGIEVLLTLIDSLIERVPAMLNALVTGLLAVVQTFLDAVPSIIKSLGVVIEQLLITITSFIPEAVEAIKTLILEILGAIREAFPEMVQTGYDMLLALLNGLRDNIGEIVTVVADIITNFLDALSLKIPELIDSVYNFLIAVVKGVVAKLVDIGSFLVPRGAELIGGLLNGISNFVTETLIPWFKDLPGKVPGWIGNVVTTLWNVGRTILAGFYNGIINFANGTLVPWIAGLPGKIYGWIGNVVTTLWHVGRTILASFYNGVINFASESLWPWFRDLPGKIYGWIGNVFSILGGKGWDVIAGLYNGIINFVNQHLTPWLWSIDNKIISWVGDLSRILYNIGASIINGLWDGMKAAWRNVTGWLGGLGGKIVNLKGPPTKDAVLLEKNGQLIFQGLRTGMEDEWDVVAKWLSTLNPADAMDNNLTQSISDMLGNLASQMNHMEEFNPVITPVLDLTRVQEDASLLNGYMTANASYDGAAKIASTQLVEDPRTPQETTGGEIRFEQNIYAPEQLSTGDIYKQTRSQLSMAKEELRIL